MSCECESTGAQSNGTEQWCFFVHDPAHYLHETGITPVIENIGYQHLSELPHRTILTQTERCDLYLFIYFSFLDFFYFAPLFIGPSLSSAEQHVVGVEAPPSISDLSSNKELLSTETLEADEASVAWPSLPFAFRVLRSSPLAILQGPETSLQT